MRKTLLAAALSLTPLAATASMGRCEDTGRRVLNRKCCPQSKDPETRRDQTPNLATL